MSGLERTVDLQGGGNCHASTKSTKRATGGCQASLAAFAALAMAFTGGDRRSGVGA